MCGARRRTRAADEVGYSTSDEEPTLLGAADPTSRSLPTPTTSRTSGTRASTPRKIATSTSSSANPSQPLIRLFSAPRKAFNKQQQEPQSLGYDPSDRHFLHDHQIPIYPTQGFLRRCILNGFQIGSFLLTLASFNILVVVAIATHLGKKMNPLHKEPPRVQVEKEWEQRISGERFSSRAECVVLRLVSDVANEASHSQVLRQLLRLRVRGYRCRDRGRFRSSPAPPDFEEAQSSCVSFTFYFAHLLLLTFLIAVGHPVILQHGILSNSVTFMVNEERSLAFWLLEQGYDVYCSNIVRSFPSSRAIEANLSSQRTNFQMPHRHVRTSFSSTTLARLTSLSVPAQRPSLLGLGDQGDWDLRPPRHRRLRPQAHRAQARVHRSLARNRNQFVPFQPSFLIAELTQCSQCSLRCRGA